MATDYKKTLRQAMEDRESKCYEAASNRCRILITNAGLENRWDIVVRALMERTIIYQRRFDETKNTNWLGMLKIDAEQILDHCERHNLDQRLAAVGHLRMGDYLIRIGECAKARDQYITGHKCLPNRTDAQHIEFKKQVLLCRVLLNSADPGLFDTLLNLLEHVSDYAQGAALEDWHKLIIRAGVHINAAKAYAHCSQTARAIAHLKAAEADATALKLEYEKPLRSQEVERLWGELQLAA